MVKIREIEINLEKLRKTGTKLVKIGGKIWRKSGKLVKKNR